ncbi:hypothetical protein Lal_00042078 [Lupinus albus]|nr:hypothetical protein Lal_00042078 [Lupinus albus]
MDSNVGDRKILETSAGVTQNNNENALTSNAWRYFEKSCIVDEKEKVECLGCKKLLSCSTKNRTSYLIHHVNNCNKNDIGFMLLDGGGRGLKKRNFDHKVNRKIIFELIISHGLPFNIVECRILDDDCRFITRNAAKSDVMKLYDIEKLKVCLTSDCCTACTNYDFIYLFAHCVDNECKLNSEILAFVHMKPSHTGKELELKVMDFIRDGGN